MNQTKVKQKWYTTLGFYKRKYGTFLVLATSLEIARRMLSPLSQKGAILGIEADLEDMSRVTKSSSWNSMRDLISQINKNPGRYKINPGVFFDRQG